MFLGKIRRGYSLVELNTSVALVALLLASAATLLWSITQYFRKSEARYLLQVQAAKSLSTISRELVQSNGSTVMVAPDGEWVSFASFRDLEGQNRRHLGALVWQSRAAFSHSAQRPQLLWERSLLGQSQEQPPTPLGLDEIRQLPNQKRIEVVGEHIQGIRFALSGNRKTCDVFIRGETQHWGKSYWVELKSTLSFRNN